MAPSASGSKPSSTSSSTPAGTGGLSLSTFATQFLKNPIASVQREEDEDDEPVSVRDLYTSWGWGGREEKGEKEVVVDGA